MKTYFHYMWYELKRHYNNDPLNIIMPIWFAISFALMISGVLMAGASVSPGNFTSLWWLILTVIGALSCPLIAIPILAWIENRYKNYRIWVNTSNADETTKENKP